MLLASSLFCLFALFASGVSSATFTWTGASGSDDNWGTAGNWMGAAAPTAAATGTIIDMTCATACSSSTSTMNIAGMSIDTLLLSSTGSSYPPTLTIPAATTLTITGTFTLGITGGTGYYPTINLDGTMVLASTCTSTFTSQGSGGEETYITSTTYTSAGVLNNSGTINVKSGTTGATGQTSILIGYDTSYNTITFNNMGNITANDPNTALVFYYITVNWYGGWWSSTTTTGSLSIYPYSYGFGYAITSISPYYSPVTFQPGSETGGILGKVVFTGNYNSFSGSSSYAATQITINTPNNLVITNASFYGCSVTFNFNATLNNCNMSNYAFLNSTKAVTAFITGYMNAPDYVGFISYPLPGNFTIFVRYGATIHMSDEFALLGNILLVNNGTFLDDSDGDFYFDSSAALVNLGLYRKTAYSADFIRGASFFTSTASNVGTFVNSGTIQLDTNGGLNFEAQTGTFYQCTHGVMKFVYGLGLATSSPGDSQMAALNVDGYFALKSLVPVTSTFSFGSYLLQWPTAQYSTAPNTIWPGSVCVSQDYPTGSSSTSICLDNVGGSFGLALNLGSFFGTLCAGTVNTGNNVVGGVCSKLSGNVAFYANSAAACDNTQQMNTACGTPTTLSCHGSSSSTISFSIGFLLLCLFATFLH